MAAEQEESTSSLFHVKGSTEDCCKGIEVGPVYLFSGTGIRNLVKLPLANLNCLSEIKLLVTKFVCKWGLILYYDCIIIQSTL